MRVVLLAAIALATFAASASGKGGGGGGRGFGASPSRSFAAPARSAAPAPTSRAKPLMPAKVAPAGKPVNTVKAVKPAKPAPVKPAQKPKPQVSVKKWTDKKGNARITSTATRRDGGTVTVRSYPNSGSVRRVTVVRDNRGALQSRTVLRREAGVTSRTTTQYAAGRKTETKVMVSARGGEKKTFSVKFKNGEPNFRPHAHRFDSGKFKGQQAITKTAKVTGDRDKDARAANKEFGFKSTPKGHDWHHERGARSMVLVPSHVHRAVPHKGSVHDLKAGSR